MGEDIYDAEQSIAGLGETEQSQEKVWAVRRTGDIKGAREIPTDTDESSQGNMYTWTTIAIGPILIPSGWK